MGEGDDSRDVLQLLENFLTSWNDRDWDRCVEGMTPDATIVGVTGEMRRDREAIREAYAKYLPTLPPDQVIGEVRVHSIRRIASDAYLLDAHLTFADQPIAGTMACVRRAGEWRISDWRAFHLASRA